MAVQISSNFLIFSVKKERPSVQQNFTRTRGNEKKKFKKEIAGSRDTVDEPEVESGSTPMSRRVFGSKRLRVPLVWLPAVVAFSKSWKLNQRGGLW